MLGRLNVIERRLTRFLSEPPSVRGAAGTIVTATAAVVVTAGVLVRLIDGNEYPNVWVGMWWALQTVTTVGYGDVTPKDVAGRLVGAVLMLEGIAFLAVVTAAITSTFVARASRQMEAAQAEGELSDRERVEAEFRAIRQKLDDIQKSLDKSQHH